MVMPEALEPSALLGFEDASASQRIEKLSRQYARVFELGDDPSTLVYHMLMDLLYFCHDRKIDVAGVIDYARNDFKEFEGLQ